MESKSRRFEMRMDAGLHDRLSSLAEDAGASVSQLIQGVMAWAVEHAYPGLPDAVDERRGLWESSGDAGVWFGWDGYKPDGEPVGGGEVVFALDFTAGRSVREGRSMR